MIPYSHAQHVHGFEDNSDSKTPNVEQDTDTDGFVELAEGVPAYGPVQLNLTTQPGDAPQLTGMGEASESNGAPLHSGPNGVVRLFHQRQV
jgi:hypothetical protein